VTQVTERIASPSFWTIVSVNWRMMSCF